MKPWFGFYFDPKKVKSSLITWVKPELAEYASFSPDGRTTRFYPKNGVSYGFENELYIQDTTQGHATLSFLTRTKTMNTGRILFHNPIIY